MNKMECARRDKIMEVMALDMCCSGSCVHEPYDCRKIEYVEYANGMIDALEAAGFLIVSADEVRLLEAQREALVDALASTPRA